MSPEERNHYEERALHPLPGWSHRRPVTIAMIIVSIVVIGVFALVRLPLEFSPEISNPWMWSFIGYPNSTPEETDRLIAKPLEEQLKRMRSLKRLELTSNSQMCSISTQFESDVDMDLAYLELRDGYDRVAAQLPQDAAQLRIFRQSSSDWPIIWMGMAYPGTQSEMNSIFTNRIQPALERVDGIAQVETHGMSDETIAVELDFNRIRALGVDLGRLYRDLVRVNSNPSVGTIDDAGDKVLVRSRFKLDSLEEFLQFPIEGGRFKLRDIATVERKLPKQTEIHRINGAEGTTISIKKESAANTVSVSDRVNDVIRQLEKDPELRGIRFIHFFNQSEWIKSSLASLRNAGLWGGLFATIIVFLFLRRLGATAIIISSVPLSVLAGLIGLMFMGLSLNVGTLMGLMLAIGMLVDNSVVVAENIFRLRRNGYAPREASLTGAASVGTAITASTLTTIIVFLPLVFARGEMGIWMRQIGTPITVSLLASLFIALSFIPLAATYFIRKPYERESRIIPKLTDVYGRVMEWILSHKLLAVLLVILVSSSIVIPKEHIVVNMHQGGGERQLFIRFFLPETMSLEESAVIMARYEAVVMGHEDELNVKNVYSKAEIGSGMIRIFLRSGGDDLLPESVIRDRIRELFPKMPGVTWGFGWRGHDSGDSTQMQITLTGNTIENLMVIAEQLGSMLRAHPQVVSVQTTDNEPMDEVQVRINRDMARRNGLEPLQISQTVSIALQGARLPRYQAPDGEIDVRMQLREADRETLDQLKNLIIYNADGTGIPLKTLARFDVVPGKTSIVRVNGKIQHKILIETRSKDTKENREIISSIVQRYRFPAGYGWSFGESFDFFDESMQEFQQTFLLALVLVILLLGALFESLIHPFTIIVSLPFAVVGVYWTLFLTNTEQNFMANIGYVILVGIVVNNAIVLVDHINQLRLAGMERRDAIIQGCKDRIRPIIMTASTTLLGLAPMAVAKETAAGSSYAPLAITVMGGLFMSTLLTLMVIPLVYSLMDELQINLNNLTRSILSPFSAGSTARHPD